MMGPDDYITKPFSTRELIVGQDKSKLTPLQKVEQQREKNVINLRFPLFETLFFQAVNGSMDHTCEIIGRNEDRNLPLPYFFIFALLSFTNVSKSTAFSHSLYCSGSSSLACFKKDWSRPIFLRSVNNSFGYDSYYRSEYFNRNEKR